MICFIGRNNFKVFCIDSCPADTVHSSHTREDRIGRKVHFHTMFFQQFNNLVCARIRFCRCNCLIKFICIKIQRLLLYLCFGKPGYFFKTFPEGILVGRASIIQYHCLHTFPDRPDQRFRLHSIFYKSFCQKWHIILYKFTLIHRE